MQAYFILPMHSQWKAGGTEGNLVHLEKKAQLRSLNQWRCGEGGGAIDHAPPAVPPTMVLTLSMA